MIETLIIINIVVSTIAPLIIGIKHFIDRINKSDCCGAKIELDHIENKSEK
jgi:hypothetical protein